jgi:hypothetical protein
MGVSFTQKLFWSFIEDKISLWSIEDVAVKRLNVYYLRLVTRKGGVRDRKK